MYSLLNSWILLITNGQLFRKASSGHFPCCIQDKAMPLLKLKTIEEGSAALVRNHLGEARLVSTPIFLRYFFNISPIFLRYFSSFSSNYQVSGPARLTLWRSKVEMLHLHYAGEGQYLEVNQYQYQSISININININQYQSISISISISGGEPTSGTQTLPSRPLPASP